MPIPAPFEILLARSGRRLPVPSDRSILDVLLEAGLRVPCLCCRGVCGTCETRVLAGLPEHLDMVLLGKDADSVDRMMLCVSRSFTPTLTLDL